MRRKYTSKACDECRRCRTKCDGKRPVCSRCQLRSISCQYRTEEDGRRPAPKSYVEMLRSRIDYLENVIRSHSIDVDNSAALAVRDDVSGENTLCLGSGCYDRDSHSTEDLSEAFEGALSLDGSLKYDRDGEVHYFGATSGHLPFQTVQDIPDSTQEQDRKAPAPSRKENNSLTGTAEQMYIPEELKDNLLDLYFKWQNPWLQVVNEKLFRESEQSGGRYSSPLLLNCMLALGSRFSDRTDIRSAPEDPSTAGRVFLQAAETLLQYEMKWPSITTIQSLAIMIDMYISIGADAASWLHQGMANRLVLDMGLNLDAETLDGSDIISHEEVELRRQIFWALYCDDKLSAAYTGRVCSMLDIQAQVKLPSIPSRDLYQHSINPYQHTVLLRAFIHISQISEKIILGLYAPKATHRGSSKLPSFLESRLLDLKNWYYDLPSELRLDRPIPGSGPLPQVYTLHMVYHTNYILLLKPLISSVSSGSRRGNVNKSISDHVLCLARKAASMSVTAAKRICAVGRKYQQAFGSFRQSAVTATYCSLSAALILIQSEYPRSHTNLSLTGNSADLETLLLVLDELSTSWDIARRIRRSLVRLLEEKSSPLPSQNLAIEQSSFQHNLLVPSLEGSASCPLANAATETQISDEALSSFSTLFPASTTTTNGREGITAAPEPLGWPLWENMDFALDGAGSLPVDYNCFDTLSSAIFDIPADWDSM
ncbi:hypothetical protein ASPWEDRAFT_112374 [Aspergillus wentii DTO 134E9]|uniref:Zn(2)-C6 fungal-type domain-containing protein n=1 Tax=Aspergillus wentii DTO 134E9 TaxID=1073089 RepID=A0A1L9RMN2_ASPWE|nr:uncharacterized protein ASPWEDRAFT_112374 [Aspergillus wentii DTO 134E9]OJJ36164.1 hypothetical protein ASPWEDRAFT_112374 [Aspergillus wentii DTO 134E9]